MLVFFFKAPYTLIFRNDWIGPIGLRFYKEYQNLDTHQKYNEKLVRKTTEQ